MKTMLIAAASAISMLGSALAREAAVSPILSLMRQVSPPNVALPSSQVPAKAAYRARPNTCSHMTVGAGIFAKKWIAKSERWLLVAISDEAAWPPRHVRPPLHEHRRALTARREGRGPGEAMFATVANFRVRPIADERQANDSAVVRDMRSRFSTQPSKPPSSVSSRASSGRMCLSALGAGSKPPIRCPRAITLPTSLFWPLPPPADGDVDHGSLNEGMSS